MQDHNTVFVTDLFIFSSGACHRLSPVSFRNLTAFRLSKTGAYVSGTNNKIPSHCIADQITRTQN